MNAHVTTRRAHRAHALSSVRNIRPRIVDDGTRVEVAVRIFSAAGASMDVDATRIWERACAKRTECVNAAQRV